MSGSDKSRSASYHPDVFEVIDLDAAKRIILTDEQGTTSEERWRLETPYLVDEIGRELELGADSCVLDYGCGVGRLAKGLVERYGCSVVGVDISESMRELAEKYVGSSRFMAVDPQMLKARVAEGWRATHAFACWVLQHCLQPATDIACIDSALAPGGKLFVLNNNGRCVPTSAGWATDGVSVEELLRARFDVIAKGHLPLGVTTPQLSSSTYTLTLRARA